MFFRRVVDTVPVEFVTIVEPHAEPYRILNPFASVSLSVLNLTLIWEDVDK